MVKNRRMEAISVIIPSYRNPKYLDLCLESLDRGQSNDSKNEVIVILDGYGEESKEVLSRYKKTVKVLDLPENKGQTYCHNTGVILASNKWILIVNDDNVFPENWDKKLNDVKYGDRVISPNQIEPMPSIFPRFIIHDFGKTPETFQYDEFIKMTSRDLTPPYNLGVRSLATVDGQTWPLFMQKKWYMLLNGIDSGFPSPAVADWDFFFRCELNGLKCIRSHEIIFYHFAGAATKRNPEQATKHAEGEMASMEYFKWKWGQYPRRDANNSILHMKNQFRGL